MLFKHSDKKIIFNESNNTGYELATLEHFTLVELQISTSIEQHKVPFEMTFYVITGCGTCAVENENVNVTIGDVLKVNSGLNRGWKNTGGKPLKLLAIRK